MFAKDALCVLLLYYSGIILQEAIQTIAKRALKSIDNNIRYAGDATILTGNKQSPLTMIQSVNDQSNNFGSNLTISKSKFMILSRSKTLYALSVANIFEGRLEFQ